MGKSILQNITPVHVKNSEQTGKSKVLPQCDKESLWQTLWILYIIVKY